MGHPELYELYGKGYITSLTSKKFIDELDVDNLKKCLSLTKQKLSDYETEASNISDDLQSGKSEYISFLKERISILENKIENFKK